MSYDTQRDELAEMSYRGNYNDRNDPRIQQLAERSDNERRRMYATADAILAAGFRKLRIIETAEDLDALPEGTEIVDRYERLTLDEDVNGYHEWHDIHGNVCSVELPATVLHVAEATR